jgi:hypothetical protein
LVAAMTRTSTSHFLGAADAAELALLQHAQQLDLQRPALISPISSRKIVPPSATSNSPLLVAVGAGERAAHVAEQLRLEQRLGHRAAVDRDERPRARRVVV